MRYLVSRRKKVNCRGRIAILFLVSTVGDEARKSVGKNMEEHEVREVRKGRGG